MSDVPLPPPLPRPLPPPAPGDALFQELLLTHYRAPRNRRLLSAPSGRGERRNALCGDEVAVEVAVEEGVVRDVAFQGRGCSIAVASASMLTEAVRDRPVSSVRELVAKVEAMLRGEPGAASDPALGTLATLAPVARFPARVGCARMAWQALEESVGRAV